MKLRLILHSVIGFALCALMLETMADSPRGRCEGVTNDSPFANRVLCNDPQLSELDDMMLELHWQKYDNASKEEKAVVAEERQRWDLEIRIPCQDELCLIDAYEKRIKELGGTPPKRVNFRIAEPHTYDEICPVFLSVINRVEPEEILPCKAPEYDVSPFSVFDEFQPMNLEEIKEFFTLNNGWIKTEDMFDKHWGFELRNIETKFTTYSKAVVDLNADGESELVVRKSIASKMCKVMPVEVDNIQDFIDDRNQRWDLMANSEKSRFSEEFGSEDYYYVVLDKSVEYLDRGVLLFFKNMGLVLDTLRMGRVNTNKPGKWNNKNWIGLVRLNEADKGEFTISNTCGFWLNY